MIKVNLVNVNNFGDPSEVNGIEYIQGDAEAPVTNKAWLLPVGSAAVNAKVLVAKPPVVNFSPSVDSGSPPLTVDFTDLTTQNPHEWAWTFGDGGQSDQQNPSHTFNSAGDYTVSLTARNYAGSGVASDIISVGGACLCDDDFTGADYNPASTAIWNYTGNFYILNNRCRFDTDWTTALLKNNCVFDGDFDVQVDAHLVTIGSLFVQKGLACRKPSDGINSGFMIRVWWYPTYENRIYTEKTDGSTVETVLTGTPDFLQFRITKEGAVLKSFYRLDSGAAWIEHASETVATPADHDEIALYTDHYQYGWVTDHDNFVVNSGCP